MTALAQRRGACPALSAPMPTGDGLLVRLNPAAGGLSPAVLAGLCRTAMRHGNGIMEVTQRGSIQIRGLTPDSAEDLAGEVNGLGIAVRTGLPVETGPLAGLDPAEIADPRPLADAIRAAARNAGLSRRLGPKVSVVVDGGGRIGMGGLLADVRLTAVGQDGATLWHLAVGGTAATARPVGLFSEMNAVAATLEALEAIAALGREGRGRDIAVGQRTPDPLRVRGGGAPLSPVGPTTPLSIFPLSNSTHALGIALPFGSMPAEKLAGLAAEAAGLGATEIRPAPGRILLAIGLSPQTCIDLRQAAARLGFVTDPADARLVIAACPGAPACGSGWLETRPLAEAVAARHADLFDGSVVLHVSGCAKGCAHPGTAALTVVGGENGTGLVADGTAGSRPAGYTPAHEAVQVLCRVAALVAEARRAGETTAACLKRLDAGAVATAFARDSE